MSFQRNVNFSKRALGIKLKLVGSQLVFTNNQHFLFACYRINKPRSLEELPLTSICLNGFQNKSVYTYLEVMPLSLVEFEPSVFKATSLICFRALNNSLTFLSHDFIVKSFLINLYVDNYTEMLCTVPKTTYCLLLLPSKSICCIYPHSHWKQ